MRVPPFRYVTPRTVEEAARVLAGEGEGALLLAGGTDLLPNMKRRQVLPRVLVSLRALRALRERAVDPDGALRLGAGVTLADVAALPARDARHRALLLAAGKVATPHIRNMGTLGGNLCVDTRCNYYDQSYEWRAAISFCKKAPGPGGTAREQASDDGVCWVAPGSPRCWAVSSTDTAPALIALGASVTLVGPHGAREVAVRDLYRNDGMAYLTRRRDEVLASVSVPALAGWRSTYWKLRRRGSFDFPVLSVAAGVRLGAGGVVEEARVVLGSVASCPLEVPTDALLGKPLSDGAIDAFADAAARPAKPLDNTDFALSWRKKAVRAYVVGALRDARGDDPAGLGVLARHAARLLPLA